MDINHIKEDRLLALQQCMVNNCFTEEGNKLENDKLEKDFGVGGFGFGELLHMSFMIYEIFEHYVLEHPSVVLDEDLYTEAHKISDDLFEFYQSIANYDYKASNIQEKQTLEEFAKWVKKDINNHLTPTDHMTINELFKRYQEGRTK